MGRTACTEPQCLYKGALYLYHSFWKPYPGSKSNAWKFSTLPFSVRNASVFSPVTVSLRHERMSYHTWLWFTQNTSEFKASLPWQARRPTHVGTRERLTFWRPFTKTFSKFIGVEQGWRTFPRARAQTAANFHRNLSRVRTDNNFRRKTSACPRQFLLLHITIIIMHIIVIGPPRNAICGGGGFWLQLRLPVLC
jgi:hypothetical protein